MSARWDNMLVWLWTQWLKNILELGEVVSLTCTACRHPIKWIYNYKLISIFYSYIIKFIPYEQRAKLKTRKTITLLYILTRFFNFCFFNFTLLNFWFIFLLLGSASFFLWLFIFWWFWGGVITDKVCHFFFIIILILEKERNRLIGNIWASIEHKSWQWQLLYSKISHSDEIPLRFVQAIFTIVYRSWWYDPSKYITVLRR